LLLATADVPVPARTTVEHLAMVVLPAQARTTVEHLATAVVPVLARVTADRLPPLAIADQQLETIGQLDAPDS
jgi:hypothetical protein